MPDPLNPLLAALLLEPEKLLAQCAQDRFQASGPGGQKRNRVYSGLRLKHGPTGLQVTASEHRESRRNLEEALRKLRMELAFGAAGARDLPAPLPIQPPVPLPPFRAKVSPSHEDFPLLAYMALRALDESQGRLEAAATRLGTGSSALARFFKLHSALWTRAGALRASHGLGPLK